MSLSAIAAVAHTAEHPEGESLVDESHVVDESLAGNSAAVDNPVERPAEHLVVESPVVVESPDFVESPAVVESPAESPAVVECPAVESPAVESSVVESHVYQAIGIDIWHTKYGEWVDSIRIEDKEFYCC